MITASEFADAVGRKKMAEALGVGATAVSNAVVRGKFPSSWFSVSEELAREADIDCPRPLFGMRPRAETQNVDSAGHFQDGAAQ